MPGLLHPGLKDRQSELARLFAQARPFRHIVIDEFLDTDFCRSLVDAFPAFDPRSAINELGEVGRKSVISNIAAIDSAYREFDSLMRDQEFLRFLGAVTGVDDLLYDPDYVGGGTHDNLDGQDLDLHVDFNFHPTRPLHRRLNLIVFLNPEWQQSWGGCLELCNDPWFPNAEETRTIAPLANRAVLFETTEHSWHGFTRITLPPERTGISRRSIAVYFYTHQRPAEETAPAHGTVYVPRHIPQHLTAGYTLEQSDIETLAVLMERRNAQIRYLYEREREFSKAISGITGSLSFRLGRMLTWPLRRLIARRAGDSRM